MRDMDNLLIFLDLNIYGCGDDITTYVIDKIFLYFASPIMILL